MIEIRRQHAVPAPAGEVWSRLRSFGDIARFSGAIERADVTGEGTGARRDLAFGSGDTATERIEALDDASRTLRYTIDATSMPLEDYHAVMRVVANGPGACTVEWSATFEAPEEAADALKTNVEGLFDEVLTNLADAYQRRAA